jgi:hypothetical protein
MNFIQNSFVLNKQRLLKKYLLIHFVRSAPFPICKKEVFLIQKMSRITKQITPSDSLDQNLYFHFFLK